MEEACKSLLFIMHDRPNYLGGPIINYLRLLPKLIESGYRVYLLSIYHKDFPNSRSLEKEGVIVFTTPYTYTIDNVNWILEKAEEIQPDVFIPDVSTAGCFAGKWIKQAGISVINTLRSDDDLNWGKAIYFSSTEFDHVLSGIVCVNSFLETNLRTKIGNSPILSAVIPSGVPIPDKSSDQLQKSLKIVYAGRLVQKQKRVKEMFEAFFKLSKEHPDITFTIIGDGPEKLNCIKLVRVSQFASQFIFTGKLLGDKYKEELQKHHIIVLLSDYEGTPGTLMDGMSCGLIPVCLHYKGCEDLIINHYTGILVNDREQSFHDAINFLYRNPLERLTLSKNARQHILEHYSINATVQKWLDFINLCCNQENKNHKFVKPNEITLPEFNPMLKEYWLKPKSFNFLQRGIARFKKLIS